MSILKETTEVLGHLLDAMPSNGLFAIREEAASFLLEKGIPSKRHEDWKYTNIKRLFDNGLTIAKGRGTRNEWRRNRTRTNSSDFRILPSTKIFQPLMA
jgi:hypothetical protein